MIVKTCNKCKTEKPLTEYAKRETKSGYRTICRQCDYKKRKEIVRVHPVLHEFECISCHTIKPIVNFNTNKRSPLGIVKYCNDCRSIKSKKRYEENKDRIKKQSNDYYYKNHTEVRKSRKGYASKRCKVDIKFKLSRRLRSRLYDALRAKSWKKTTKFYDYIGCSLDELKHHLESQFTVGMNWDNYGKWHIDHITPLSSADTEEEMYKLCHYTNLQPLWAEDNIKKGCKV